MNVFFLLVDSPLPFPYILGVTECSPLSSGTKNDGPWNLARILSPVTDFFFLFFLYYICLLTHSLGVLMSTHPSILLVDCSRGETERIGATHFYFILALSFDFLCSMFVANVTVIYDC